MQDHEAVLNSTAIRHPRVAEIPRVTADWVLAYGPEHVWLSHEAYERAKRVLDLGLIVVASPLLLPLWALTWTAVRLEYPRSPALFVQRRTGRNGKRFRMFKFRTMVPDAEALKDRLVAQSQRRWPDFKLDHDPRITPLGRLLRKTSLDELPQLINVLRGEMSLVGPRPTSFGVETYQEWHKARLKAAPGITGLWQVLGRGWMEFDDRSRLDILYVERRCLLLDLQILARTLGAVIRMKGAS